MWVSVFCFRRKMLVVYRKEGVRSSFRNVCVYVLQLYDVMSQKEAVVAPRTPEIIKFHNKLRCLRHLDERKWDHVNMKQTLISLSKLPTPCTVMLYSTFIIIILYMFRAGTAVAQWLRCCATNR